MRKRTIHILVLCVVFLLPIGIAPLPSNTAAPLEEPYVFLQSWGNEIGMFHSPTGIAVSGDRVHVVDRDARRVQIFDLHGRPLVILGGAGSGDGQFSYPEGIAVDGSGNVYVADSGNYRVQKFSSDGTYLTQWGSKGSGDGQFVSPRGIAVDGSGNVYVADSGNYRVQKFSSDGTYLAQWGSESSGGGQFNGARGIAVDGSGNVYVVDLYNGRIQKFTSDGTYLTQWGSFGTGDGQFRSPYGIAVDGSGNVYVADGGNHRIQKFTSDGTYLSQWGSWGTGDGQFVHPEGVAVDRSGNVYVADTGNDRIQKFTSDGTFRTKWGSWCSGEGQFNLPQDIAIDGSRSIYVADTFNHRIQKFTSDGTFLTEWGEYGSGDGEFRHPWSITVDGDGIVYVADRGNGRIQAFTPDGLFLYKWETFGAKSIAFDTRGYVYATGHEYDIFRFTVTGQLVGGWRIRDAGYYYTIWPLGVAVDKSWNVYVTDNRDGNVLKFTSDGVFLAEWWGGNGPFGITSDGRGNVYVADGYGDALQAFSGGWSVTNLAQAPSDWNAFCPRNRSFHVASRSDHCIRKFTADGTFLTQWGNWGNGDGQFNSPSGLAVDAAGSIYAVDTWNYRIQKFAANHPTPDPVYGLALNGSFEETPDLVRWTYGGGLPVGLVNDAFHGTRAVQLGEPTPQTEHEQGMAWMRQTMYIRPEWERPVLTFRYRMFVNDIIHYSDFHVWLTRSNGAWLAEIKRDGFRSCYDPPRAPPPGYDLGWRTGMYDLSAFKGETVRVVFENRNLHGGYSWGIWTYVDDVRVVDAGPLPTPPGPPRAYLPLVTSNPPCDPVEYPLGVQSVARSVAP